MKRQLLILQLAGLVSSFLLYSCQKDTGAGPLGADNNRLKSYTEDIKSPTWGNTVNVYDVSYDGNNRITGIVSVTVPGNKILYTYKTASNYAMDIYSSNVLEIHEEFYLNNQGLPDSTFQYNSTADSSTEKYLYNAKNELTHLYEYDYSAVNGSFLWNITEYTYDAGGNMATAANAYDEEFSYEYYPDLVYIYPPLSPGPQPIKKNLLKKQTLSSSGFPVANASFTYTFDSNSRISTETAVVSDGTTVTKTFTYY